MRRSCDLSQSHNHILTLYFNILRYLFGPIVQMARTSALHAEGPRFEPE